MSEYHTDQDEQDFFDQSKLELHKGCIKPFKVLLLVLALMIAFLLCIYGCKSAAPPVTLPYGPVISIDGDQVEVAFEVINRQKGSQISGWFYMPGHGFQKGDIFPDFTKYRHPLPRPDGNR